MLTLLTEATLSENLTSVIDAIKGAFTTADLMTVVTATIGAVAAYVVLWFGVRFVTRKVTRGIFGGRLHV